MAIPFLGREVRRSIGDPMAGRRCSPGYPEAKMPADAVELKWSFANYSCMRRINH
jgi:hypothetical protein